MSAPLPLAEAQARLLDSVDPLGAEALSTAGAAGRYLAQPVLARRTQPAADLSAMDGYALREDEWGPWRVIGESAAGHPFAGTVGPGQAVRISTGALMPKGADAVLLQENAAREGDHLTLNGGGNPSPGHIRRRGFDFGEGEMLLDTGTLLGPAQVALAFAGANATLTAHRLPRVAVLDSGDELSAEVADLPAHKLPASNGPMLAAMAAPFAASVKALGPVPDQLEALVAALDAAGGADVIVTSGGASVGDHDLILPALEAWGAQIDFWRVAIKPGKPLLLARKGAQLVLGLPGNPVSSYVTAFLFLAPLLRRLAGAPRPLPEAIRARLTRPLPPGGARTEFVRARLDGETVTPFGELDSSALRTLALANALIERPIGAPAAAVDAMVPVYRLQIG